MTMKTSCGGSLVEHAISDEKIHEIKTFIKRALLPTLFFERKKQKTKHSKSHFEQYQFGDFMM